MIGFETSDLKKRRKVDFYNHVAARHHTGVHDVGFGATVKSQCYACAYVFFGTFFTSGNRSRGRRSDLLRVLLMHRTIPQSQWLGACIPLNRRQASSMGLASGC